MEYYRWIREIDDDWAEPAKVKILPANDVYAEKMELLLGAYPTIGVPPEPSCILGCLFLGTSANAENIPLLKALGITYVLNCGGSSRLTYRRMLDLYGPNSGILGYEELNAEDAERFDITSVFDRAHGFIDFARRRGGRVMVFCPGVSRSGAIAISFMVRSGIPLLQAAQTVKDQRRLVLCNTGFIKQLVSYSRDRGLLDEDMAIARAPAYGRTIDRPRIFSSHLPTVL